MWRSSSSSSSSSGFVWSSESFFLIELQQSMYLVVLYLDVL